MKHTLLLLLGLLSATLLTAQSLERQVVANGGASLTGTNALLDLTAGEMTIATQSGSNAILTQGFQQSRLTVTSIDEPAIAGNYDIKVFPNPVQDQLYFEATGDLEPIQTVITDMRGKFIREQRDMQMGQRYSFPMQQLADGMYFVRVFDAYGQPLKTFKVSKTN